MHKKIISFLSMLLLVTLTLQSGALSAEENSYNSKQAMEILESLEIYPQQKPGFVTKDFILNSLFAFQYEDVEIIDKESMARNVGMIEYGEVYGGEDSVKYDEAIKYAVSMLGYRIEAEVQGGYPAGYKKIASSIGLLNGLNYSGSSYITMSDLTRMLYNMLDVEPMVSREGGRIYEKAENETLLSLYRNIHKISGIETANSTTSIYSEEGCVDGYITVSGENFAVTENIKDFLGKNIEAYIKADDDGKSILYLNEKANENEYLSLNGEDIESIADDYSFIKYEDENNRLKNIKLEATPKIIYNGVFYGGYTKSDFMPEVGGLELIDNDNNGKFDVVFITSYETVIVKGKDITNKIIYNKVRIAGHMPELDLEDGNVEYKIFKSEEEITFSELKIGDILSVAASKNQKNKTAKIIVSDVTVEGPVQYLANDEIKIEDKLYMISSAFERFKAAEKKQLKVGEFYKFYLDTFGNVAYFEYGPAEIYVLLYKVYANDAGDGYGMEYMNMSGEWVKADFASKVSMDGEKAKAVEKVYSDIKGVKAEIVLIRLNSKGEVRSIERAKQTDASDESKFTKTPPDLLIWRSTPRTFQTKIYLEDDAKLVLIPSDVNDKGGFSVREAAGYFKGDTKYTISAYNIDKFGFTSLISMAYTSGSGTNLSSSWFIVTGTSFVLVDGEVCDQIQGNTGVFRDFNVVGKSGTFSKIKNGDIIKLSINQKGIADYAEKKYSLSADFVPVNVSNYHLSESLIAGTVVDVDSTKERILLDCGGTQVSFRLTSSVGIQKYDVQKETCELTDTSGILMGDEVVCRVAHTSITDMIIRK